MLMSKMEDAKISDFLLKDLAFSLSQDHRQCQKLIFKILDLVIQTYIYKMRSVWEKEYQG